jgi:endogenous inhibitor of DNA gyrase (YacG/DUF329 family)
VINLEENKTEKCPRCGKMIGLFEAVDHESFCSNCYWEVNEDNTIDYRKE